MWCTLVLVLALSLSLGSQEESGCDSWDSVDHIKCCSRCKPGNRLLTRCGEDPKTLCVLCENGTYVTDRSKSHCYRCSECLAPMRVKKPCTAWSDTVCECVEGFRCGGNRCSYCIKECGKGQQPTNNRDCQPCPEGTFNNKVHQSCLKWSSRCPMPEQKIVANGTAISDIVCGPADDQKPSTPRPNADSKDSSPWATLVIVIACAFLILASAVPFFMAVKCKSRQTPKIVPRPEEVPTGRRQLPEPEQCSLCFPQEEHGSSSEESLVSEDKPFELVV
ncbi:tumor necrosis factor receptor superfamily member 9b [Hoplias malabaricus]|uniref:tumor necrosis factor receptor superfamily member 9b n=1 Tax=Hoplias malabaricus TaxID=27720 RepID=UPI0034627125